jgi:uncharacterized protein YndB with AHSA1/START domain
MAQPSLTLVRRFKAPVARVFAAMTQAEHIARWWGPDPGEALSAEADARPGGRYRVVFQTRDGLTHETFGTYHEVVPDRRVVFTMSWTTTPDRESLVTLDFAAVPEGTELTVLHEQFVDEAVRVSHLQGWSGTLEKLRVLLETAPETARTPTA